MGNGVTTTYTYDSQNYRLTTLKTVRGTTTLQTLGYTFDNGGNVTGITDSRHGNQTFSYDALDRLTGATNSTTGGYGTISYTYNQIGNLLTNSQVGSYTYNASGTSSTRPHAVTQTGTGATAVTYSYDANGNLSGGGGRTLTWDAENRPTQIVKGGVTTTFVYDGDGGRVKKTVQGTTTVYIGQLYVCVGTACEKLIYAGTQRVAMVQVNGGSISYFHGDHLGSTSVLTDSTGTEEEHNSYEPYGDIHTHTGTADVAYKYTGQERDASTDLYFYQARYYAQGLGRFVSPDTIVQNPLDPQAFNRYAYARNNPLRYTDPTGYWWDDPFDWLPCCDWTDWGPWDNPDFGWSYSDPIEAYIDPVTGRATLPEMVVHGRPDPPKSLFPDLLGRAWGADSLVTSTSFASVVLVGGPESQRQFLRQVSGAGSSITFTAGPEIYVEPYSYSFPGVDYFSYTVAYRPLDATGNAESHFVSEPFTRTAATGLVLNAFGLEGPPQTFTAPGNYDRVQWRVTIPLQPSTHGNSAGWHLRVYGSP